MAALRQTPGLAQDASAVETIHPEANFTACWEAICDIVD